VSDVAAISSLPAAEPERYVDARELASLMSVSLSSVKRMKAAGMPHVTWGMKLVRYRPSVALQWAREQGYMGDSPS